MRVRFDHFSHVLSLSALSEYGTRAAKLLDRLNAGAGDFDLSEEDCKILSSALNLAFDSILLSIKGLRLSDPTDHRIETAEAITSLLFEIDGNLAGIYGSWLRIMDPLEYERALEAESKEARRIDIEQNQEFLRDRLKS